MIQRTTNFASIIEFSGTTNNDKIRVHIKLLRVGCKIIMSLMGIPKGDIVRKYLQEFFSDGGITSLIRETDR